MLTSDISGRRSNIKADKYQIASMKETKYWIFFLNRQIVMVNAQGKNKKVFVNLGNSKTHKL